MASGWGKLRTEVLNDQNALLHQILLGLSDNTGRDGRSWTIKHAHRPVVIKREGAKPSDRSGYRWRDKINNEPQIKRWMVRTGIA